MDVDGSILEVVTGRVNGGAGFTTFTGFSGISIPGVKHGCFGAGENARKIGWDNHGGFSWGHTDTYFYSYYY